MKIVGSLYLLILLVVMETSSFIAYNGFVEHIYSTNVSEFKVAIFYYGWLNTSNILDYRFDILVFSGSREIMENQYSVVMEAMERGVEAYAYIHDGDEPVGLGSSFKQMVVDNDTGSIDDRVSYWKQYIMGVIGEYSGLVNGVFLDECDPGYFGTTDPGNIYLQYFTSCLEEIVDYAYSIGLKVFINGVRAYAGYGDYYLWEDFVAVYDYDSGEYTIDQGFFNTYSNNPYEWVNGMAKYSYLRDHGLLNKTIALSFSNTSTISYAEYGYYMARILGLGGWSFSPIDIYAGGEPVTIANVYEIGLALTEPFIDTSSSNASRLFTSGWVIVDLDDMFLEKPFNYIVYRLDCIPDEYVLEYPLASGDYTVINSYGYNMSIEYLYIFINTSWSVEPSNGVLHVYLDYDGDYSTGYVSGYGSDYLVEVYSDGSGSIYNYTGSGFDWSWSFLTNIPLSMKYSSDYLVFELSIPSKFIEYNVSRFQVATVVSWSDDASLESSVVIDSFYTPPPTIYDNPLDYTKYYSIIVDMELSSDYLLFIANASTRDLVEYRVYTPFTVVASVYKNGSCLQEFFEPNFTCEGYYVTVYSNYSVVFVRVCHNSTLFIVINGSTPPPISESSYIVYIAIVLVVIWFIYIVYRIYKVFA